MEAYLAALEQRVAAGEPVDRIRSVASFFVSRVDTNADQKLDRLAQNAETKEKKRLARELRGKLAIANAKLAYQAFLEVFGEPAFQGPRGARARRAAAALGLDLHQGPRLSRPLLRRGADRPAHGGHDAARDLRGLPRARRPAGADRGRSRGRARGLSRVCGAGLDEEQIFRELEEEGIQKFSESYERSARRSEKKRRP